MNQSSLFRYAVGSALFVLAATVAGCGGSLHHSTPPDSAPVVDAFFTYVSAHLALSETEEPAAIDSVTATAPETTEPEPVN